MYILAMGQWAHEAMGLINGTPPAVTSSPLPDGSGPHLLCTYLSTYEVGT